MNTRSKIVGLACVLGAQLACGPTGSDVEAVQSEIKVRVNGSTPIIYGWPTQRQITYCIAGAPGSPPLFPDTAFHDVIVNAFAAQQNPGTVWMNAGDVVLTHSTGDDATCGANSHVEVNVFFDPSVGVGAALTDKGFPDSPKPRKLRIGPRGGGSQADHNWLARHEFGHVLGFQDNNFNTGDIDVDGVFDPLTIMDPTAQHSMSSQDIKAMNKLYGIPLVSLGVPAGVTFAGRPAISSWGSSHLDVFERSTDNRLWWKKSDNNGATWSSWTSLGVSNIADSPAAVSWDVNRIDVFARGTGNDLKHAFFANNTWTWDPLVLATGLASSVGVSSWQPGRLDVFYRNSSSQLHHRWYDNGWGATDDNLNCPIVSSPAAVSWGQNRIDIVARGSSNLMHVFFSNGFQGCEPIADLSDVDQDPGISSWGANRMDVFARRTSQKITRAFFDGNNGGWEGGTFPPHWDPLSGHAASGPAATSHVGVQKIYLVMLDAAGNVAFTVQDTDGLWKVSH